MSDICSEYIGVRQSADRDLIDDGGPAFAFPAETGIHAGCSGMSTRTYLAGQAIQGMLSGKWWQEYDAKTFAGFAFEIADAMIAESKS